MNSSATILLILTFGLCHFAQPFATSPQSSAMMRIRKHHKLHTFGGTSSLKSDSSSTASVGFRSSIRNDADPILLRTRTSCIFQQTRNFVLSRVKHVLDICSQWPQIRRSAVKALATVFLTLTLATSSCLAVSGGRAGGSFKQSSRPSTSRPMRQTPRRNFQRDYYGNRYGGRFGYPRLPFRGYGRPYGAGAGQTYQSVAVAPKRAVVGPFSASDLMLLTGTSALIGYGFVNGQKGQDTGSPLGPGASMATVVVSMDVPNRHDPNSILKRLKKVTSRFDLSTRKGVQGLISEGKNVTSFAL